MTRPSLRDSPFALRGKVLTTAGIVEGAVVVEGRKVKEVLASPSDGNLPAHVQRVHLVGPGFVELQVNGAFAVEVGVEPDAIARLARRLPSTGITAFAPTLVSSPPEVYRRVSDEWEAARSARGARVLGLHLEGPFLSSERVGAHRREVIERADLSFLDELLRRQVVALMTLAPERPGAGELVRRLVDAGVVASLGHTAASYEQFTGAVDAGATMATHLYNAMSPFNHRAPGAIGAALTDDRVTVGLIADGVHSAKAALCLAVRAKGVERIALVTDAMSAAGMGPGTYRLGGLAVTVEGTSARVASGSLAGSVLTLDQAVRNMVAWTGVRLSDALRMASEVPAAVLGRRDLGRLAPGLDADLVVLDDKLGVESTYVGGELVFHRGAD